MSQSCYFHPTDKRTRLSLRHLPTVVFPGERGLASVEVGGEAFLWDMSCTTWRQLQEALVVGNRALPVDIDVRGVTNPVPKIHLSLLGAAAY